MTETQESPNLFELQGVDGDTQITYSATSVIGQPELSYQGFHGENAFSGDAIDSAETALGTELTVVLEAVADLKSVTLTLVLPRHLGQQSFSTFAVITTNPTTIAGPQDGHPQTYEVIALEGAAQFVEA
jgi:hypothetical protein